MNYQSLLQGMIYGFFDREDYGNFIHNEGYRLENKVFKMFVFSNLFGNYTIENKNMIFDNQIQFYIASQNEEFIQYIYQFLMNNEYVLLNHQRLKIENMQFEGPPYFKGTKEVSLKTLSPVVAYRTVDKYVTYYKPSDTDFQSLCMTNLQEKNEAIKTPIQQLQFSVNEVLFEKRRFVRFKNTFYIAYLTEIKASVNYDTLNLIYNTGLSSKGSSGFGMIEVKR